MDLVGKRNVTSPIWEHFGFVPNEKGEPNNLDEAICRLCGKKLSVKRANTSNLQSHLQSCHPAAYTQLMSSERKRPASQLGIAEAFSKMTKYKRESDKWKTLTRNVATFLVVENAPLRTVEKPAFREMLQSFDKQYELPSKKYFSNTVIPQLFNETKEKIITELHDLDFFSTTTDMWSSVHMTPFMSLTVHFINKNWDLKSRCLQTAFTPESHTADNLAESLRSAFKEWGLNEKNLACITTDNGANIVAAVRKLEWPWLNCFGHNLNLAVTNSMSAEKERTSRAMGLCRNLVTAFAHSWSRKKKLLEEQEALNLPTHSLILVS